MCFPFLSNRFWLLTLIYSNEIDILQKKIGPKRSSLPEIGAQTPPFLQLPLPTVFPDKAKRTQQGDLLLLYHLGKNKAFLGSFGFTMEVKLKIGPFLQPISAKKRSIPVDAEG